MAAATQRKGKPSPLFARWFRMRSWVNVLRLAVYVAVLAWTIIVLAIAAHFQSLLVPGELTRYVPLSIFIATATLLVMIALLLAPVVLRHNPISTRIELACLAFLGIFWLSLGAYTGTADMGDLECFAGDDSDDPIEVAGFSNDIYHTQYRTLEGFALFNVILLGAFLFFMLSLSLIQHNRGFDTVWHTPLPLYPWFNRNKRPIRGNSRSTKLPPPVTSNMKQSGKAAPYTEKYVPPIAKSTPILVVPVKPPAVPKPVKHYPTRAQTRPTPARAQTNPSRPQATTAAPPRAAATGGAGPVGTKMYSVFMAPPRPAPPPPPPAARPRPSQRAATAPVPKRK